MAKCLSGKLAEGPPHREADLLVGQLGIPWQVLRFGEIKSKINPFLYNNKPMLLRGPFFYDQLE